jgi:hypothetical protein
MIGKKVKGLELVQAIVRPRMHNTTFETLIEDLTDVHND